MDCAEVIQHQWGRTLTVEEAKVGAVLRAYDDISLAMDGLMAGRVDAVIRACPVVGHCVPVKEGFKCGLRDPRRRQGPFGLSGKDAGSVALLNAGLKKVRENGGCDAIVTRWIDSTSPLNA